MLEIPALEFALSPEMTRGQKAMAIAKLATAEITLKALAKATGISRSALSAARIILLKGTPEEITAVENGTEAFWATHQRIFPRAGGRRFPNAKHATQLKGRRTGSLIAAAREGISWQQQGQTPTQAAKRAGLSLHGYAVVRDMLLLSERDDLSEKDAATVAAALTEVETTRALQEPWARVRPIAERVWGVGGNRRKSDKKRTTQFDHAISFVLSTCESAAEIDIPYISEEQAEQAQRSVARAFRALRILKGRIRRSQHG